jgi:hypothetical protein
MPEYKLVNGEMLEITGDELAQLLARRAEAAAAIKTFNEVQVTSADEVDRVTIKRIRNLIAPNKPPDLQASAEARLNAITNYLNAKVSRGHNLTQAQRDSLDAAIALWEQVEIIRAEGIAFKTAQGWQ